MREPVRLVRMRDFILFFFLIVYFLVFFIFFYVGENKMKNCENI